MSERDLGEWPLSSAEPFVDPQAELGVRRGLTRVRRLFEQGQPVQPLEGFQPHGAAQRQDVAEATVELRRLCALVAELVEVDSGEIVVARKKMALSAQRPYDEFRVEAPDQFHSLKVDNPTGAIVEIIFSGSQPNAGNSEERVPAHTGRIITAPYDAVAIGFDPANVPAGVSALYCTFYSRPLPPASYPFV